MFAVFALVTVVASALTALGGHVAFLIRLRAVHPELWRAYRRIAFSVAHSGLKHRQLASAVHTRIEDGSVRRARRRDLICKVAFATVSLLAALALLTTRVLPLLLTRGTFLYPECRPPCTLRAFSAGMIFRAFSTAFLAVFLASGCVQVTKGRNEQRVIELPSGNPAATLAAAKTICGEVAGDLGAELHQRFPGLTQQQFQGVFLHWNEGTFPKTGHTVFITTGITYQGELPAAKEIADACEAGVRRMVAAKFPTPAR